MTSFRIKVCGITRPQDAQAASDLGADMIGMIFYEKSPRYLTERRAVAVAQALPRFVAKAGVFVDARPEHILGLCDLLDLEYVQLHGDESGADIRKLQRSGVKVIKAFSVHGHDDWQAIRSSPADLVLVDHATARQRGGTGRTFDWRFQPGHPISNLVLSGGISEQNVLRGIQVFRPWMVDVNSTLELRPGVKSIRKLRRFFAVCDSVRYGTEEVQLAR